MLAKQICPQRDLFALLCGQCPTSAPIAIIECRVQISSLCYSLANIKNNGGLVDSKLGRSPIKRSV